MQLWACEYLISAFCTICVIYVKGIYKKMKADSTLIQPDDSADKLLRILLTKGGFEPGAHIDYYDAHVSDPLDFKPLV